MTVSPVLQEREPIKKMVHHDGGGNQDSHSTVEYNSSKQPLFVIINNRATKNPLTCQLAIHRLFQRF